MTKPLERLGDAQPLDELHNHEVVAGLVLLKLAVHPQAYPQVLGVGDLERRRDARSEGERAVDGLRGEPVVDESVRRYRLPLVVAAGGDVVGDAVSGDV